MKRTIARAAAAIGICIAVAALTALELVEAVRNQRTKQRKENE